MGKMCTGYKKNGDGVATEEMSDGGSIEQDGSHSKAPVLEEDDIRGRLTSAIRSEANQMIFKL